MNSSRNRSGIRRLGVRSLHLNQSSRPSIRRRPSRFGIAAVEFAVIAPVMILFMFGMVEIGRVMMVKNAATHASREGARIAVTPTASIEEVEQRVTEQMEAYGSSEIEISITPNQLSAAAPGDMVTVRVSVDVASIRLVGDFLDLPISSLVSETTMRRETTN